MPIRRQEKAARRQRPPRRCPAPPCWALIQAPVLQVLPNTCSPSAKPAARSWPSRSRRTSRSAGSAWPTGWTRGLCRIHGRLPAGRYGLSHPQTDDSFFRSDTSLYNASISGLATLVSVSWYMHKRPASKDARRLLCGKFGESARRMPLAAGYALCITVFCSTANAPGDRTSGLWSRFFPQDLVEGGVELVNHLGRDGLAQLAKQLV